MRKIFRLCIAISLVIPTSLYTFNHEKIVVSAKISGNYSYESIGNNEVQITNYNGGEKNVTIPSEIDGFKVTKIGYGAFAECKSIETLVIPKTVTVIDSYAFSQCDQIISIEMPNSVTSMGRYAFAGNAKLKSITIPEKLRNIGYGTFFGCLSLEDIVMSEGLQTIGSLSFGNCKSLVSIDFPSTLISLESNAFMDCVSLREVTLPEGTESLGSSAFSGCLSLTSITLPSTLTGISQSAFKDCISLEKILIPESVSAIGNGAFSGCTSLKDINIPKKVTFIGNAMFSGCSSLKTLIIPSTVEELGENVFSGCSSLEEITIPDSVTLIGQATFSYCSSLKKVKLPKGLKNIEASLFRYCGSLETLIIPNGVTEIGATAFADCTKLKSVTFPATITQVNSRILSNSNLAVMSVIDKSASHTYARQNSIPFKLIQSGINLDKEKVSMKVGDTDFFAVILSPYTVLDNKQLSWSSSNPEVVKVDDAGVITALQTGTSTITVRNANGSTSSALVSVDNDIIPITSVDLNLNDLTLKKETSLGIRATINPNETTMSKVLQWESDNTEVATVSSTGTILAKSPGKTTIRVKTSNGKFAECVVTVISEISSVSLNQTAMVMNTGTRQSLRATINPSDTTDSKNVTWISSNTKVATVNQSGEVTSLAPGTATISVITVNGRRAECKITVVEESQNYPILSVALDKTDETVIKGDTLELIATINPSNTTDSKTLIWESSNNNVATVNNGVVTAKEIGSAIIKVTTSNGKSATCKINVSANKIEVTSVTFNKSTLSLTAGKEEKLITTVNPSDATDKTLEWKSSNTNVATVDDKGNVKAITKGTTKITATSRNGKVATCTVTVSSKPTSIVVDNELSSMYIGDVVKFSATVLPTDTLNKDVEWTSSDSNIVRIDSIGKATAVSTGKATIKVSAKADSSIKKEFIITVVQKQGWNKKENGEWEYYIDGKTIDGWQAIDGLQYYFKNKEMVHDWFLDENTQTWYFFNGGVMQRSDIEINGVIYKFDINGIWRGYEPRWVWYQNNYYYKDEWNNNVKGWKAIDGLQYKFREDGTMIRDWYLDESTQTWYFFNGGVMQRSNLVINGKVNIFDNNGIWRGIMD